jgi:hypothetical protein
LELCFVLQASNLHANLWICFCRYNLCFCMRINPEVHVPSCTSETTFRS